MVSKGVKGRKSCVCVWCMVVGSVVVVGMGEEWMEVQEAIKV